MGLRSLALTILLAALLALPSLLVGCGGDDDGAPPRRVERPEPIAQGRARPRGLDRHEHFFDQEGMLLPSDTVVAGLPLPMGFELVSDEERRHVYKSPLSVIHAQRYFGPRLMTTDVRRVGSGAVFVDAAPMDARGSVVRLDVSIYPRSGGGSRIEIVERLPAGAEPAPLPPELTEDE